MTTNLFDMTTNNLPIQLTSFIGREREIAEVKRLLGATRLLTLTGSGGAGKTRLALQVASQLIEQYAHGTWFVDLAPLNDSTLVPQAIASVFDLRQSADVPVIAVLTDYLRSKNLLLVLDNCEHLIVSCAQVADSLLRHCPNLSILATSREPLGIGGEFSFRVPSLLLPDSLAARIELIAQSEAIKLFNERATATHHDFKLTNQNVSTIAQICQRLDGMPLAIELAAARTRSLSVEQIVARLDDRFRLLTTGSRTAPTRQQTLREAMDWSYDLLSEQERILFRRLSVFAGGLTLQVAESICLGDGIDPREMLDLLSSLVDKSLVMLSQYDEGAEVSYRLLETIRQYAHARMDEAGESTEIRNRHLDYFLELAREAGQQLRGVNQMQWLRRFDMERDNLRAAMKWTIESNQTEKALSLAASLGRFWRMRSEFTEGRLWFERIFALTDIHQYPCACASALVAQATLVWLQTSPTNALARSYFERALAIARANGDKSNCAFALDFMGLITSMVEQDHATAGAYLEESRMLFQEIGDRWGLAQAIWHLGFVAEEREDKANALELCEQSLAIFRECGDQHPQSVLLQIIGRLLWEKGERARGIALVRQALVLAQRIDSKFEIANALYSLSKRLQDDPARTVRLLMASRGVYESIGSIKGNVFNQHLLALRAQLGDAEYASACEEGRAMTLEQAIEYALAEKTTAPSPISSSHDPKVLTPREVDVLRLVAEGLSDAQIAEKLVISVRTVNTHLSSIYSKLGVKSRSAATRYALDHNLV
ncbi:MAG: AAA family ATPase [Chloroflexi bacterium]|nr:AAA family ATPase [Chloroflexota bacterium]